MLSRFSLANAQTKALTNGITRMSLLTLSSIVMENYKRSKISLKNNYGLKSWPESTAFDTDHPTAVQ